MTRRSPAAQLAASIVAVLLVASPVLGQADDDLTAALASIEDLTLFRTLQFDDAQLGQLITAVESIVALLDTQRQQEDAALEALADAFRQAREALLLGAPIPPETAKLLDQAAADEASRAAQYKSQLDAQIDAIRNLLHPRQLALVDWRTEEERAETTLRPSDPQQAAFLAMALNAVDQVRGLHFQRYWERLDVAAQFLATFVPPASSEYRMRYRRVLDIFERALQTPPEQYSVARVSLAQELLRAVGVAPEAARAQPTITREAFARALTRPGTVELLREMLQAQQPRRRRR
ncbi:MAG: hypothetical protein ACE5JM_04640 [Armatimonadota bacterium]